MYENIKIADERFCMGSKTLYKHNNADFCQDPRVVAFDVVSNWESALFHPSSLIYHYTRGNCRAKSDNITKPALRCCFPKN